MHWDPNFVIIWRTDALAWVAWKRHWNAPSPVSGGRRHDLQEAIHGLWCGVLRKAVRHLHPGQHHGIWFTPLFTLDELRSAR
jgi:hypothetical protein